MWVGREAARELCDRAALPVLVQNVADNYQSVADAVRTVTGATHDPDSHYARYPPADGALAAVPAFAAGGRTHRSDGRETAGRPAGRD